MGDSAHLLHSHRGQAKFVAGDRGSLVFKKSINKGVLNLISSNKITNPMSGKVERDLMQAEAIIDTLTMLRDKTRGNLGEAEQRLVDSIIADGQLNYVEEKKRPEPSSQTAAPEPPAEYDPATPASDKND